MPWKFKGKVAKFDGHSGEIQPDGGGPLISFNELDVMSFLRLNDSVDYNTKTSSANTIVAVDVTLVAEPLVRSISLDHRGGGGRGRGGGAPASSSSSDSKVRLAVCLLCYDRDHREGQCPMREGSSSSSASRIEYCVICQKPGHSTDKCPNDKASASSSSSSPSSNNCNNCGEPGHIAENCPENTCFVCGNPRHYAKDCPFGQDRRCYFCGEYGHMESGCRTLKQHGQTKCYRCSNLGHKTHECTEFNDGGRPIGGRMSGGGVGAEGECLGCGRQGHSARMCRHYFD